MERIKFADILSYPFYPMRPLTGPLLKSENVFDRVMERINSGSLAQRKLNGDRAIVAVKDAKVYIFNRHMSPYKHAVSNISSFLRYSTVVLDGEVWQSKFYPFEGLIFNGLEMCDYGPKDRESLAKHVCKDVGLPWMFEATEEWIKSEMLKPHTLKSQYEGVVLKDGPYRTLGAETQTSTKWSKWKWI